MTDELLATLRKRFQPIEGQVPHSVTDILHEVGSVGGALLYSCLFVPRFIEVDDSVLIDLDGANVRDRFRAAKARGDLSLAELEASFNFVEVPYLFSDRETTDAEISLLAEKLRDTWRCWLRNLYPDRRFTVTVLGPQETGDVVALQFYEVRN